MDILIKKIRSEDQEEALKFCLSIFEELEWDKSFAYGLDNLKDFFGKPKEAFFVAKQERIIGCGGIKRLTEQEALLKRFYVSKEFRGRGLADSIMEKIKSFARQNNYSFIVLDVFQNNSRAQRFFEKQGFSVFNPKPYENWKESQFPELFEFRKFKI